MLSLFAGAVLAVELWQTPLPHYITGEGKFRYEYDPTKLGLPLGVQLKNAHGLALSHADGSIYFTYESMDGTKSDPATRALIRYDADGTNPTLLGADNRLAQGVPHGLKLSVEDGVEYLYHANNVATVTKTDMKANIIWSTNMTREWTNTSSWPFKPTDVLVPPGSDQARGRAHASALPRPPHPPPPPSATGPPRPGAGGGGDGYGSSKVHGFDLRTGNFTGFVFGGQGSGDDPVEFNCDHGMSYDTRVEQVVVADRANHQLRWLDPATQKQVRKHAYPESPLPCNAQTSLGTELGGDYMIVPDLGEPTTGNVYILDASNTIVSTLTVSKLLGRDGSKHPHDAIFLRNGDVAVVCWNPGTITYWKRLPEEADAPGEQQKPAEAAPLDEL